MDAGELVSDSIVNGIVSERIKRNDCKKGFILDGYPRNVSQAETFRKLVKNSDHLAVIELSADSERSRKEERLGGRLLCPGCGATYNEFSTASKQHQICDLCGCQLLHRSDDREELT